MFKPNDEVAVSMPQLHGRSSVIEKGEVVSISGNMATVVLKGEDAPRRVPVDRLHDAEEYFGGMTGMPNEPCVIDAIRR